MRREHRVGLPVGDRPRLAGERVQPVGVQHDRRGRGPDQVPHERDRRRVGPEPGTDRRARRPPRRVGAPRRGRPRRRSRRRSRATAPPPPPARPPGSPPARPPAPPRPRTPRRCAGRRRPPTARPRSSRGTPPPPGRPPWTACGPRSSRGATAASTSAGSVSPVVRGTSSSGNPMSTTRTSPASSAPGIRTVPIFGAPIATVSLAPTAGPATPPVVPSTPLGMSTATTGHGARGERLDRRRQIALGRSVEPGPHERVHRDVGARERPGEPGAGPGRGRRPPRPASPIVAKCSAAIRPSSPLCPVPASDDGPPAVGAARDIERRPGRPRNRPAPSRWPTGSPPRSSPDPGPPPRPASAPASRRLPHPDREGDRVRLLVREGDQHAVDAERRRARRGAAREGDAGRPARRARVTEMSCQRLPR